jgi:hypothetical protein
MTGHETNGGWAWRRMEAANKREEAKKKKREKGEKGKRRKEGGKSHKGDGGGKQSHISKGGHHRVREDGWRGSAEDHRSRAWTDNCGREQRTSSTFSTT